MGVVVPFPLWRAVCRYDGETSGGSGAGARGEPWALVDPGGRRHDIEEILRRRLVASREPSAPIRHELEVRAGGALFRLSRSEPSQDWLVEPL